MKISTYQLAKFHIANDQIKSQSAQTLQFPSVKIESSTDSIDLERKLERFLHLKDILSDVNNEYNALKKELKEFFEGMHEAFVGSYKITGKYKDMPGHEVAAYKYWNMKIRKL